MGQHLLGLPKASTATQTHSNQPSNMKEGIIVVQVSGCKYNKETKERSHPKGNKDTYL
jgi:hypothetical protein